MTRDVATHAAQRGPCAVTTGRRLLSTALIPVVVGAAVALSGAVLGVLLTSDRARYPVATAIVSLAAGGAFVAGGVVAWRRQPTNRAGWLMVATGFVLLLVPLSHAESPWPFTLGIALLPAPMALFAHLLLAFPTGRLPGRQERVVVTLGYLDAVVVEILMLLVMDDVQLYPCPCPRNVLFALHLPTVHDAVMAVQRTAGWLLTLWVIVLVVRRWRAASPPLRRSLAPVLMTGAVSAVVTGTWFLLTQVSGGERAVWFQLVATATFALLPVGFLAGLVRARLARAAVGDLVIELSGAMRPGQVRDALARALGDPALSLTYAREDGRGYVDLAGAPAEPTAGEGQVVTGVEHDGRRVAAVVHDASLTEDPALVEAAFAAAAMALENERLQAELRARLEDLRASRARIVHAGDTERRRLERNLHDGAQQRLVSVSIALGLATSALATRPEEAREIVSSAQRELGDALAELRELARGIHPAILTAQGLPAALDALGARVPVPVELDVAPGRLTEAVEAAAYYVVAETVTNAVKYAEAQRVRVEIARAEGEVVVTVSDDGRGGADPAAGSGLRGLADRVEALDGRFAVDSPPGGGTTVTAVLPCA
jgi:signal transduction histidine kinase